MSIEDAREFLHMHLWETAGFQYRDDIWNFKYNPDSKNDGLARLRKGERDHIICKYLGID